MHLSTSWLAPVWVVVFSHSAEPTNRCAQHVSLFYSQSPLGPDTTGCILGRLSWFAPFGVPGNKLRYLGKYSKLSDQHFDTLLSKENDNPSSLYVDGIIIIFII